MRNQILLLVLGLIAGALIGISFNLGKLVNKKIEPEIITNTVWYYNGQELDDCPLADKLPCHDLDGSIVVQPTFGSYWYGVFPNQK